MPPAPRANDAAAAPAEEFRPASTGIAVLTDDHEFLDLVATIATGRHRLHYAANPIELRGLVRREPCGLVIADRSLTGTDFTTLVQDLATLDSAVVTVAVGGHADGEALLGLMNAGQVYRFLLKPISARNLGIAIESGLRHHEELRAAERVSEAATVPSRRSPRMLVVLPAAAAAVLGAVGLGAMLIGGEDAPTASAGRPDQPAAAAGTDPAAAAQDARSREIAQLLGRAREAARDGRAVSPAGDSAHDHYRAALRLDPQNGDARAGLQTLMDDLVSAAESGLLDGRLEDTEVALTDLRRIREDHPRLNFLSAQLAAAREAAEARRAAARREARPPAANPEPATPSPLEARLNAAAARLADGRLVTPPADSARHHLVAAAVLAPGDERVRNAFAALHDRLLERSRTAIRSGDFDAGAARLEQARALAAEPAAPDTLRAAWQSAQNDTAARLHAALLDRARQLLAEGRFAGPTGESAGDLLARLAALAPAHAGLAQARGELSTRLLALTDEAIAESDWNGADYWLEQAAGLDLARAAVDERRRRMNHLQRQAELLSQPVSAAKLTLVDYEAPSYPPYAIRRNLEGWVELEFIVDRDGTTRDHRVIDAEPAELFDDAAIDATSQWRFEPTVEDGKPLARLAQIRVRFTLD